MGDFPRRSLLGSVLAVAVLTSQVVLVGAPGFGLIRKKKVDLQVRKPAVVRLANASLAVRGKSTDNRYQTVVPGLETSLETELVSNERTLLKKTAAEADWVLELTVTAYTAPTVQRRVQQMKNGAPITFNRWTGSLNVAYQVVDKTGRVHDADNVMDQYDQEFQANANQQPSGGFRIPTLPIPGQSKAPTTAEPRSPDDVRQVLVQNVVNRIASQLGNTMEKVEAQVAVGDDVLDRAATFMEQRLWARAVEELEKAPAYTKPEDESYRRYSLGLAYEAMSYDATTFTTQRANLFQAQEHYDKAAELNPDQKYFVEVIARTRDSVARYRALDSMQKGDQAQAANAKPSPGGSAQQPPSKPASQTLTVNDVIEMRAAGVPDPQIIELIRVSPVAFALDRDTLLAMAKAKVPDTIQNELRVKAGLEPLAPAQKTASPASKPSTQGKPASPAQGK